MQRDLHHKNEAAAAAAGGSTDATHSASGVDVDRPQLLTRSLSKVDYDYIVRVIDKWWGGPTSALAHPMFFYELGSSAMVVETAGRLVGFLFGFVAPNGPTGYVHLVGIDPEFRRKQVGTRLYEAFEVSCREAKCKELKAITTFGNAGSARFHEALGWAAEKVDNYAGPGRDRLVFRKALDD